MITKEAIEAAARAACEDNVQRIHKAAHDSGSSASMSDNEYYMYPPYGWIDLLASMEAGITAALAAMPGPAETEIVRHKKRGTTYDVIAKGRFQVDGDLDMEKVTVYRGQDGQVWVRPDYEFNDGRFEVISALTPAPDLASENERLRAALGAMKTPTVWTVEFTTPEDDEGETASFAFADKGEFEKFTSAMHGRVISIFERDCVTAEDAIDRAALERT